MGTGKTVCCPFKVIRGWVDVPFFLLIQLKFNSFILFHRVKRVLRIIYPDGGWRIPITLQTTFSTESTNTRVTEKREIHFPPMICERNWTGRRTGSWFGVRIIFCLLFGSFQKDPKIVHEGRL